MPERWSMRIITSGCVLVSEDVPGPSCAPHGVKEEYRDEAHEPPGRKRFAALSQFGAS